MVNAVPQSFFAYVGSRTTRERNARGEGITVFRFDPATGGLDHVQTVVDLVNPSFLHLNASGSVLYAVHGDQDSVSAFRVDNDTGCLTFLNRQCCEGRNPVHLTLSLDGRRLMVANHNTGTLAVLSVTSAGALGPVVQKVALWGEPGPHRIEQPFSKPHFTGLDRTGRWLVVPDKGLDKLFVFRTDRGQLDPAPCPCVSSREGAGPRHVAFHPNQAWLYALNELDNTVTGYHFNRETGQLSPFQVVSTLQDTFTGNNRASGIEVDAAGRALYVSNRGEDSIAVLSVDPLNGRLTRIQSVHAGGKTPRFFTIDPSQRWLLSLQENSDKIKVFPRNQLTGELGSTGAEKHCGSPVCLVFSASNI